MVRRSADWKKVPSAASIAAREAFYTELSQSDDKLTTLNRHLLTVTEGTKRYVLAKNHPLHPKTEDMILFLQKELKQ